MMKADKSGQNKIKPMNPDSALKNMSELLTRLQEVTNIDTRDADNQKLELSKEIFRLGKSVKEFYKDKNDKHKKKKKDSKQT